MTSAAEDMATASDGSATVIESPLLQNGVMANFLQKIKKRGEVIKIVIRKSVISQSYTLPKLDSLQSQL